MAGAVRTVGINALFLDPGRSGGPETYLRQLVPALRAEFPGTRFVVATTRRGGAALRADGWPDVEALAADEGQRARRTAAEQVLLPLLARRRRWDVLHSLASVAPIRAGVPAVITLHDVNFFHHRTFGPVTTFGMRQIVARAARRADALVTASRAARDDICAVLGLDPARFEVVPHGGGRPPAVEPTPEHELRRRLDLDGRAVALCVAAKRPHKNQALLVRAAPTLPGDAAVVLAGHPEAYDHELRALAHELGVQDRVRFLDYVADADLEGLWRLAGCAVFPTLAEGFGLPVLEAMRRAVPVACSDIPVLREVGGDAARYFDPHDPDAAASAIVAAMGDPDLGRAGEAQAARFSWTAAARGTFAAYERAVAARAR